MLLVLLLSRKVWTFQVAVRNQYLGSQHAAVNITGGLLEMERNTNGNLKFHLLAELIYIKVSQNFRQNKWRIAMQRNISPISNICYFPYRPSKGKQAIPTLWAWRVSCFVKTPCSAVLLKPTV